MCQWRAREESWLTPKWSEGILRQWNFMPQMHRLGHADHYESGHWARAYVVETTPINQLTTRVSTCFKTMRLEASVIRSGRPRSRVSSGVAEAE
jgi:hypothetical protein